jgi:hypothetical protein
MILFFIQFFLSSRIGDYQKVFLIKIEPRSEVLEIYNPCHRAVGCAAADRMLLFHFYFTGKQGKIQRFFAPDMDHFGIFFAIFCGIISSVTAIYKFCN